MSKINERILLILAILCIFIIIPCSFASDVNDNTTLTDNPVADENSIYVSLEGNDDTGEGTEANPYQSVSKAVDNYDSSKNSNIFIKNGTYTFNGKVTINKAVTIIGESNTGVILDGNYTSAIFEVDARGANVQLSGLTFINGYSDRSSYYSGAAAIDVSSVNNFIVDNCIFENNNGGAVTADGNNVLIKDSIFINNTNNGWGRDGGAISSGGRNTILNITNCQFINNSAYGGAAVSISNKRVESYISGSTFIENNATIGSAIYAYNGNSILLSDNIFTGNNASKDNYIIDVEAYQYDGVIKNLTLKNNVFSNNYPSDEISTNMNKIYIDKNDRISGIDIDTMNVGSDVNFTVTLTDEKGVGIPDKTITITFTDFIGRVNSYVAVTNGEGKATISLVNQTAGTFTVESSFEGDSLWDAVKTTNSVKIKAKNSYNIVFNESIVKVKAGESYKVLATICNEYITPVYIFNTVSISWRTPTGGIRYTEGGVISGPNFVVDVIDFDLSTSSTYYYINFTAKADSTTVEAKGTLIIDTSIPLPPVDKDIEVIYVAKDGSDEFGDGTEENPLATIQTALYVNEVFGGNKTVFVKEGVYDVSNYEIYANVSIIGEKSKTIFKQTQGDDGMLYLDNGATTRFTNITFTGGKVAEYTLYGTVIVVRYPGSIAYFDGCEFINNTGSSDGIVYVAANAVAYFDNCVFKDNYAWTLNAAGAIQVHNAYLSVNNSYFENNTAAEGAGIFIGGDAYANIENTVFYQNKALNDSYAISGGGAIYVNNYNTHITNCSFIENYAEVNGGAIYILTGKVEIEKCLFENNHVESGSGKGSAIASDSGYTVLLYVDHSVFISDDYSKMIAIVNDMAEENEIILNYNYWGTSSQSGIKTRAVIKATTNITEIHEGDAVEVTVEFVESSGSALNKPVHDFSLDLITQLGRVDVNSINIVNNIAKFTYYATKVGNENIIMSHNQTLYTLKFRVNASEANKTDFSANISMKNKTHIIVEVPINITNNITLRLDGVDSSVKADDGIVTLDISNVLPGSHGLQVKYDGDDEYKSYISEVFGFSIDKYETNLKINVTGGFAGDQILVNISANDKFTGNVVVIINNKNHTVSLTDGQGSTNIVLASGNYTAEAVFGGNTYFEADKSNTTFEVKESVITVIYVAANGSDDNDGSLASPYATISKALDRNKALGGNRTIIVSEGNYTLNRYAITNDVSIVGEGSVVISQSANTNHIYIGGNVNVVLDGLTFINGIGVQSGSIDMGSDDAGNIGKTLTITNCDFINNTGLVGTIASYANTTITKSNFINNTATGTDGYNQAIVSIQDNSVNLANNIFLNNNYKNEIIVSRVAGQANDNFWGNNNKPGDVDKKLDLTSWVCVVPSIDEDVRAKTNYDLVVKFQKTNDGVKFSDVGEMPSLTVDVEAQNGEINQTGILISKNIGVANYIISHKGSDVINVNLCGSTIASLEFNVDVPEVDKIYVSVNGSDSNSGSRDAPLKTIKEALAQNKANGGNKTIVLLAGEFKEQDLVIDALVTIIGENATINGGLGNIFTISADAEIAYIAFINASDAIKQLEGNLYVYETEFVNNTNAIVSKEYLKIENTTFAKNNNAIISDVIYIDNCEFIQNTGIVADVKDIAIVANSRFADNEEVLKLKDSFAQIENNTFENNGVAIDTLKTTAIIKNNSFTGELIVFNESKIDLVENTNVTIRLTNSNITNAVVSFIEGKTIIVNNGTIELNATVTDNMGNIIDGGKITFTSNGEVIGTADVENGVAILKYPFTKGNYTISGTFDSCKDATVTDGLVRVDVDYYWFIGEVGYENLSDAINAAKLGDVIKGIPGTYNIGKLQIGHRYMSIQPWEIFKSITITSMNDTPVTLKGSGVQMFFIDVGSELTLKNLIIRDAGSLSDDGGAIGTLYNTNLTIVNCTFTNNIGGDGGAIYTIGATNLVIEDTVFDSNTGLMAGALQIVAYGYQDITLKNLTFTNNQAHYAGAFYNGGATLEISNAKFINNTASVGGAMYTSGGSIDVSDSEFISNKAVSNDAVTTTAMGGAFHNLLGDATFRNVKFIDNYAEGLGGAMELENGYYGTVSWTIIDNCTFENNFARDGGAIYLGETYDPYVKITASVFDSNTAENNGAAISDNFGHVSVEGTKFIGNKAGSLDIIHVVGDMVESNPYYGSIDIKNCEFTSNDADYVIFTNAYGDVSVSDTNFDTQKMTIFNRGEASFRNVAVTNSSDYVIENLGNLTLSKNTFDTPILNKNEIKSITYIVVLGNETKSAPIGEKYLLTAVVVDDNNNLIESGNLVFVISGSQIPAVYQNNQYAANYTVLNGTQKIDALIDDDGLTQLKVKTGTLIGKNSAELTVEVPEAKVGDAAVITVRLNPQATGNVTINVGNKTYEVAINKGTAKLSIPDLKAGEYPVDVTYEGDENYAPASEVKTLNVTKVTDYIISTDVSKGGVGDDITINVILPSDANGLASVIVDDDEYPVIINNGRTSVVVSNLAVGNHNLTVNYYGNDKYDASTLKTTFKVAKLESYVKIVVEDVVLDSDAVINLIVPSDATGTIIVTVDGKDYIANIDGGKASVSVPNLDLGEHNVEADYVGDNLYLDSNNKTSFKVINKITVKNTVIELTIDGATIIGLLKDGDGNPVANALIRYGGNSTVATGSDGTFNIVPEKGVKTSIVFDGDENYAPSNTSITIKSPVPTQVTPTNFDFESVLFIKGYAIDTKAGEKGIEFIAHLLDANGKPLANKTVQLAVNSKVYNQTTNETGGVHYFLNMMKAGRYTMTYIFLGDGEYGSCLASACVDLEKKPITIKASAKTFKTSAKTKKYTVTLSTIVGSSADGKAHLKTGMKVTLTVNGKTYTAKTNSKGQATFNIKITKKGKYTASIKTAGDDTYKAASKSVKITVK
ncbi:MAG: Ig-like domain repeat protein [Methanobrevibacter sp.]|nr:Ig-like domain repeat protein [Methanobrevibacter sp.]